MAERKGRVEGRVALVTGAGEGIGRATARALADEGAPVVMADVRGHEQAAEAIRSAGGHAVGVRMDVTDAAAVEAAVALAVERFGGLNILVNNAGIGWHTPLEEIEEGDWDRILGVNLKGPFLCARAAVRHLGGGAIVNVASVAGRSSSMANGCHYTASKAGLLGLTRHLAREFGPRGIRVNAVCPGPIQTALLDSEIDEEGKRRLVANVPLGRLGVPEDIARVIVFLASEDAAFITGAALDANGGIFMA